MALRVINEISTIFLFAIVFLVILKNEREVRASVNYVPQLQLILRLDTYIDPQFHQEIFGDDKILNAHFFIIFFDFRNEDIKKQVLEIFKYRS